MEMDLPPTVTRLLTKLAPVLEDAHASGPLN